MRVEPGRVAAVAVLRASHHELNGPTVVGLTGALMGAAAWLSVTLSDRLGLFFGVCLTLTALTAALVVDTEGLFTAGVLPPLLLVTAVMAVVLVAPSAVDAAQLAQDAGAVQRVIAGVANQATPLVLGHLAALTIVGLRIRSAMTPD